MEPSDEISEFDSFYAENFEYFNDLSENKEICPDCTRSVALHKEDNSICEFTRPW